MRGYEHDEARHQWFATHRADYRGHMYFDDQEDWRERVAQEMPSWSDEELAEVRCRALEKNSADPR